MDKLIALKEVMDSISKDSCKFFEKGNKAAGTRARKQLQELKRLAQELRVGIQETKARMSHGVQQQRYMGQEEYVAPDMYKAGEGFKVEDSSGFKIETPVGGNAFGSKVEQTTGGMPTSLGGGVTSVSGVHSVGGVGGVSTGMGGVSSGMGGISATGGVPASQSQFGVKQQ